jgi:hypothetical protein
MADDKTHLRWNLLADEEVKRKADDAFGVHTAYAELLLQIAKDCPTPFSIGLYSGWGTGKTSIVRLLQELVEEDKTKFLTLVYLDVWKYSSDPLKRWILLETERQLEDQGIVTDYQYQNRTLASHLEYEEAWEEKGQVQLRYDLLTKYAPTITAVSAILCLALIGFADSGFAFLRTLSYLFALITGGGVVATIADKFFKKLLGAAVEMAVTRTTKHITALPAFSSEKFGLIFRDIVAQVTGGPTNRRLIFVFDNLDRCPAETAVEVIGVVKTFLDEPGCIYVIPCDEQAILTHVKCRFLTSPGSDSSDTHANQFLAKFFQMTLRLPPAADFAVEDYLDKELKEAKMEDLPTDARDVLVLGYRGETPRQVKRVLNDLIAYRGVAEQIEAQGLVDKGVLTSDLGHLTKMAVLSVKWPSFVRKVAEDPEKWVEVMRAVRAERTVDMEEVKQDLAQFLWSTRLVSPDADIRPWLYLSRGSLEKDAALTRRIEEILQNGAWKQLSDILSDKVLQEKKDQVLQIASSATRRWLKSGRRVLLRNSGPVLLKASLANPDDRELRRDALDVLDYLAANASPEEMEQVFDVKDVLAVTSGSPDWQRSQLLGKYTELFETRYPLTEPRKEICKQLIQHGDLLENPARNHISKLMVDRYTASNGENEVLDLLGFASEEPLQRGWMVTPALLAVIGAVTTFDSSPLDLQRVAVLAKFRKIQGSTGLQNLFTKIGQVISPARTSAADPPVLIAIVFLKQLEPESIPREPLKTIVDAFLVQANRTPVQDRAPWLGALIHFFTVLQPDALSQVEALLKNTFVDADPNQALKLSQSLEGDSRRRLLPFDPFRPIFRAQPAAYQSRYGANANNYRQQHLEVFEPDDLLNHSDVFDESLSWDLALFIKTATRALDTQKISSEELESRVKTFCIKYLPAKLPTQKELYAALLELTEKHPEVLHAALAHLLTTCECSKIVAGDFSSYSRFSKTKGILPLEQRQEFVDSLLKYLEGRKGAWVQLLLLLIDDVTKDIELSQNARIVGDLADLSFQATKEKWVETVDTLGSIVRFLEPAQQQDYSDRAIDVLLGLSAEGEDLPRMEPFLRLASSFPGHITGPTGAKTTKFVHRMLGAAKSETAKLRTLQFVSTLDSTALASLKTEIEPLTAASEPKVSEAAKELLQKIAG